MDYGLEMLNFDYISREIENNLKQKKRSNRAEVLFGPRQVGKSTLLAHIMENQQTHLLTGDDENDVKILSDPSTYLPLLKDYPNLVIDEAQYIPSIGRVIKRMVDNNETNCHIFVTGSSSLDLAGGVMESAAGRINTYSLWPFSLRELAKNSSWLEVKRSLTERMIYGCYPTVVNEPQYAREYLRDFVSSVLYKDLFNLAEMRKPTDLRKLVTYLAYNVGSEIKYVTVSNELGISAKTIERYVHLLQSCFIVRVVPSFSRNPQSEIKLGKKIYFIDNGIRNALISGGFNPFASRPDTGSLWENLFFTERLKKHSYSKDGTEIYFWRTRFLQEMDFVEVTDGKMKAFECKVTPRIRGKSVRAFKNAYPECPVTVASPENIEELDGI